ncbi:MAG: putative Ig domain-containing protein [Candidatus Pseudobacter hemicellulosilyticus]|uniref:Alpha-galactosidase n=1 Tax=Candidatus Pseudobacter hemicellulosilyticus TaxID=3121375 RepID=A0AAJ6BJ17_9BACT|nr:MAG: putative Ig domain-containing protein [Pseudobacter sp.]
MIHSAMAQETNEPAVKISQWKFSFGQSPEWIQPDFDDRDWPGIQVNAAWESQGFGERNGDACYRARVLIPSTLQQPDKAGLCFSMGAIDDMDSVFVNGHFIGATRVFTEERFYFLHYNSGVIRWDAPNVIVVKVFDETGWGGMYRGEPMIRAAHRSEFITLDPLPGEWQLADDNRISKKVRLYAKASVVFSGGLRVELVEPWSKERQQLKQWQVSFSDKDTVEQFLDIPLPAAASYQLLYTFEEATTASQQTVRENLPYVLTPPAPQQPVIGGAKVIGLRPGSPLLYSIAATGQRPMRFTAKGLPAGLQLDPETGIINGVLEQEGEYQVMLMARNKKGRHQSTLLIKAGQQLALTPPMGWNSWNVWGVRVDEKKILDAANAMVQQGLVNYGWTYINMDDGWQAQRAADGHLQPGPQFPDMRRLTDSIHRLGLKAGIYSSPGPSTCGNFTGSYQQETRDVADWARWGFDLVKYDWCSFGNTPEAKRPDGLQYPYKQLDKALRQQPRDIVLSLCQYGMGEVWQWGHEVGGQLWRTGGDITDTWPSILELGFGNNAKAAYQQPGRWNDPDMLVLGRLGWGELRPSRLTPDEQYTHMSLWCIQAAPLLLGCDLQQLDLFSKGLLCNTEVLAINQDPLGAPGMEYYHQDSLVVFRKPLQDGSVALAIVNLKNDYINVPLTAAMLGLPGAYRLRDCWRQQDLGVYKEGMNARLAAHGVWLLKAIPK